MAATKAPKEKITLRDGVDLLQLLNQAIEDHIDEIEMNDGALPDWMAALLDEIETATAERVDALIAKLHEFQGYASTAKAKKDLEARRERVWSNVVASMKAYGLQQVQRAGVDRLRGANGGAIRIQKNSAPSTVVALTDEQLLAICDEDARNLLAPAKPGYKAHALSPFITVTRMAVVDRKALAAAYEARRDELVRESELLGTSDAIEHLAENDPTVDDVHSDLSPERIAAALADIRRNYVTECLAREFPGVQCVRNFHLRID